MNNICQMLICIAVSIGAGEVAAKVSSISGAGATFPSPVYVKWAEDYTKKTGIQLHYQSVGSGAGVKKIKEKTVDFGASDRALNFDAPSNEEEREEKKSLFQFPSIIGGVVLAYNLQGWPKGKKVVFSGAVLADIYGKKITKWNDEALQHLNPTVELPDKDITVIYRSDNSGTTFLFTTYLSRVNPQDWKNKVNTYIEWPTGLGGKGNEVVCEIVKKTDGAIGYVEYAYAKHHNIAFGDMFNKEGKIVSAQSKSFAAAARDARLDDMNDLIDKPGDQSWPIVGASFIIMQKKGDAEKNHEVLDFFNWAFDNGGQIADGLEYAFLPADVISKVRALWRREQTTWTPS